METEHSESCQRENMTYMQLFSVSFARIKKEHIQGIRGNMKTREKPETEKNATGHNHTLSPLGKIVFLIGWDSSYYSRYLTYFLQQTQWPTVSHIFLAANVTLGLQRPFSSRLRGTDSTKGFGETPSHFTEGGRMQTMEYFNAWHLVRLLLRSF